MRKVLRWQDCTKETYGNKKEIENYSIHAYNFSLKRNSEKKKVYHTKDRSIPKAVASLEVDEITIQICISKSIFVTQLISFCHRRLVLARLGFLLLWLLLLRFPIEAQRVPSFGEN